MQPSPLLIKIISQPVRDLAVRLGIPLVDRSSENDYAWDGSSVAIVDRNDHDVTHDIAHWICASPKRRLRPDFGLGTGPDSGKHVKSFVGEEFSDREEWQASLLGIAILVGLGLPFEYVFEHHNWIDWHPHENAYSPGHEFWPTIVRLQQRGLLDENGQATCLRPGWSPPDKRRRYQTWNYENSDV